MKPKTDDMKKDKTQKFLTGKVIGMKMQKTIVVEVIHQFRHPLYKKAVNRMQKFVVHNEIEGIAVKDMVQIKETKPISKNKHFIVVAKVA